MRPHLAVRIALTASAVFLLSAAATLSTAVERVEERFLEALSSEDVDWLDPIARAISRATDSLPLAVLTVTLTLVLLRRHPWRAVGILPALVAVALVVNPLLKQVVDRPRPMVRDLAADTSSLAFPAGHAATTAAIALGLTAAVAISERPRLGRHALVAVLLAAALLVVAASQLALGRHHPTDILAGWSWVLALSTGAAAAIARRRGL
ncbi:MAG: phosphatase PAP2 family protein [Actinomycetota bacterium]